MAASVSLDSEQCISVNTAKPPGFGRQIGTGSVLCSPKQHADCRSENHCDNAGANAGDKSVDACIFHQVFEYRRN